MRHTATAALLLGLVLLGVATPVTAGEEPKWRNGVSLMGEPVHAGGFTRFADRNAIKILRRDPKTGKSRVIPIAYDFLADGSHPEMNLVLVAGDTMFVP